MTHASDVRFEKVEKRFGNLIALHSLDLDIPKGSLFSIIGPSGCGKTTTLRMVAGFEQPTTGNVFIGNNNVTSVPAYRRNFGMVFQNYALFPHLSVEENVRFGLDMRGITGARAKEKVNSALELVALLALRDRYPRQLSGGQQQRAALARAIAYEPEVLLLDEPLGALDKMLRDSMQTEIRRLQQRLGTTTIFVTHDQEEAMTMSDYIAVMSEGRLQQIGTPREVYERPRNEFVATFLGASNIIDGTLKGQSGGKVTIECLGSHFEVQGQPHMDGAKVRLSLRPEKIKVDAQGPVTGIVKNILFRGSSSFATIDVAGQEINMAISGDWPFDQVSKGSRVGLRFDVGDLIVLSQHE